MLLRLVMISFLLLMSSQVFAGSFVKEVTSTYGGNLLIEIEDQGSTYQFSIKSGWICKIPVHDSIPVQRMYSKDGTPMSGTLDSMYVIPPNVTAKLVVYSNNELVFESNIGLFGSSLVLKISKDLIKDSKFTITRSEYPMPAIDRYWFYLEKIVNEKFKEK